MARFFITDSSDGLGLLTAKRLIAQGHSVVLHARNTQRADDARRECPGAAAVVVGNLLDLAETRALAKSADAEGPFDGVLHNAGIGMYTDRQGDTFYINTLAPYVLAASMARPRRLVFISSGLHYSGRACLGSDRQLRSCSYSDTKLHDVMLAKAFARRWPTVESNAANPSWVPTKMGGSSAPDSIDAGVDTYMMAILGEGAAKGQTGKYFSSSAEKKPNALADDVNLQDKLVKELERISGVAIPE